MKIVLLSHSETGGAGRAAHRLHLGLQKIGMDSQMLVQKKSSETAGVMSQVRGLQKLSTNLKLGERLDKVPLAFYSSRDHNQFSPQWIPDLLPSKIQSLDSDVVNVHWTGHGFLQIESMSRIKSPIVWTLHDMWAFTGGCHYASDCKGYTKQCGTCPQLHSNRACDLSRWIWKRKSSAWKSLDLTIVTPSQWLAKCASNSTLFQQARIEVIHNGLDTQTYKPIDQAFARSVLNLPQDRHLVLFGAMFGTGDRRKGFHLLQPALNRLRQTEWGDRTDLVVFGSASPQNSTDVDFKIHALGRLKDEFSLALAYAATDVFVAPSIEDNLPNTIMEASACGTPCVGFYTGGIPDLISHKETGYLCQPFEVEDLMQGISWVLRNSDRRRKLGEAARTKVETEFSYRRQAQKYADLFVELV